MEIGVRDGGLKEAGFETLAAGLGSLGIGAVEVAFPRDGRVPLPVSGDPILLDEAGCRRYWDEAASGGIRVSALLISQNFGREPVEPEIEWAVSAVRAAENLGAAAVRIDSVMAGHDDRPVAERAERFAGAAAEALRATAGSPVRLGIENHGRQGNNSEWMDAVLRRVDDPRLGLTLDIANWYWYGHPLSQLYSIYDRYAPHTVHTHVKSIAYPPDLRDRQREIGYRYAELCCPLDEGDIDLGRVVALLSAAGYRGDLIIENESLGRHEPAARAGILRRDVAHLRTVLAAAG